MRALVPLGEKSSESVPERVFPYRHILEEHTPINQNFLIKLLRNTGHEMI